MTNYFIHTAKTTDGILDSGLFQNEMRIPFKCYMAGFERIRLAVKSIPGFTAKPGEMSETSLNNPEEFICSALSRRIFYYDEPTEVS